MPSKGVAETSREFRKAAHRLPFAELLLSAAAVPPHFDDPKLWILTGQLRLNSQREQVHLSTGTQAEYGYAGSASNDLAHALIALFGESAERFALLPQRSKSSLCSFSELESRRALDPQRIVAGQRRQAPDRTHLAMRWLMGQLAVSGEPIQVPRQLIEVPYIFSRKEAILRSPITTGAAAGYSIPDCTVRGLLEIIERDAFMLSWLLQAPLGSLPPLKANHPNTKALRALLQQCERYQLAVELRVVPCSLPVAVIASFVFDDADAPTPRLAVGASAALSVEEAALKALLEAMQLRSWLRSDRRLRPTRAEASGPIPHDIRTIRQRAGLLFRHDYCASIRSWITEPQLASITNCAESLQQLATAVESEGGTVIVIDLSDRLPEAVRNAGFVVAKTVVPEFQPLYLNERAQDLSWERINCRRVQKDGSSKWPKINPLPHPFL